MMEPRLSDEDAATPTQRTWTGWIQLALVIAVVLVTLVLNRVLLSGGDDGPAITLSPAPPAVSVIHPELTSATITVVESGVVRTRADIAITPQVSGRIVEVASNLATGGVFSANQTLFVIDPTDLELAVQQAEADLQTAQSALLLEEAEGESARREWRLVNAAAPVPPLVAREPQIAQARASVAAAQARLNDVRTDLGRTRYGLPFDGRVLSTTIELGQTVAANQSYGRVYNVDGLEVSVSIPAEALNVLRPVVSRRASIRGVNDPSGPGVAARVARVSAELDPQTRLAGLVLSFDETPLLLPGAFVRADIMGDRVEEVLRLPADAIGAGGVVWVVADSVLRARRPTLVSRQGAFVIVEAFDVADGVVTTLPPGAREGLNVVVAESPTTEDGQWAAE